MKQGVLHNVQTINEIRITLAVSRITDEREKKGKNTQEDLNL